MSNSNSNDVDILSGCADTIPSAADSTNPKRLRFSIEQLAERNTCSPLINIVNPAIRVEKLSSASTSSSCTTVTTAATITPVSKTNNVELFGPDGPVSISFVKDTVADVPVTHKKLEFSSVKVESRNEKVSSNRTNDSNACVGVENTSSGAKKKEEVEQMSDGDVMDSLTITADGTSSATEGSDFKDQLTLPRSKTNRRLKRRAKMKRLEERRKWLAKEKKILFSGLKSNRPLTRSLDKLKNVTSDTLGNTNTDEISTANDTLDDLQVDCDQLNVDTVDCVQVSVSDVDCGDGNADGTAKTIDVGTNSDLCALASFSPIERTGVDKENHSGSYIKLSGESATSAETKPLLKFSHKKMPSISPMMLYSMPPYREKEKQTRTTLTLQEKVKVIEAFLDGKSQRQIAQLNNIGKTQVSGIIKKREEILALYRSNLIRGDKLTAKRQRKSEYALLNEHLIKWYRHMSSGTKITTGMLRAKALQIAPQLGYHDFKASNGWLATFKGNNNLKFSRALSNSAATGDATNNNNSSNNGYGNTTKLEHSDRNNGPPMEEEPSYFEEADVETNTTEEEDPNPMLGSEGDAGSIMDSVGGGGSVMGRVGEGIPPAGGPCSGGFLTSPGLLQGAAAAAILKCGVSVAGQSASNLPPQLPMEAFHLSRSAGAMDHNSPAAHHHPHHHHHHHHPSAGGPPSLALAAAGKGDQSAAAAAAAAAGVLGYKSEEPLGYGGYDHHHHHHQLQARMAPDQLTPQLAGRAAMAGDQLAGRMVGDGGGSSVATAAAAASSSAAAAAVAAAARTSEYNYAPYTFPSGYYGYHFLGQY